MRAELISLKIVTTQIGRRHQRAWRGLVVSVVALAAIGCSVNVLKEFGDPEDDQALLFSAKDALDRGSYTEAIAAVDAMTTEFQARRDVKLVKASALAGRCGVNLVQLVQQIDSLGTTRVMNWLFTAFPGGNASRQTDCVASETIFKGISTAASGRTADENLVAAFVGFAKVGVILTRYGDASPANGSLDAGFDPCVVGSLPSAAAKEVATGFNFAIDALQNLGSYSVGGAVVTNLTSACGLLPPGYLPLCSSPPQVNTADIDANEEKGIRSLINESSNVGLGVCTGDPAACACP